MKKVVGTLALMAFLALGLGGQIGCASRDKVTEEDRVVLDHAVQIAGLLVASMATPGVQPAAVAGLLVDLEANVKQLQDNWGKPKEPTPYSPEAAKLAREKAKGSHDVGFWGWLAGAALGAGGVALTLARFAGRFLPGIGPVFAVVDKLMLGAETVMAKFKAGGNTEAAQEVAKTLAEIQEGNPSVKAYVEAKLPAIKARYGVDLAAILAGAAQAAPAPAPTPPAPAS